MGEAPDLPFHSLCLCHPYGYGLFVLRHARPPLVVRRLLAGQSAVWVLLESGDAERDQAAAERLQTELRRAEAELELPVPEEESAEDDLEELWIEFSTVRLSRGAPGRSPFTEIFSVGSSAGAAAGFARVLPFCLGTENSTRDTSSPALFKTF